MKQGKYAEAVQILEAIDKGSSNSVAARAYNELAICYFERNDLEHAGSSLEASLQAVPGNATAIYLKSFLRFRSEQYAESQKLISAYLQSNPASVGAHKILGMDEYMLGNYSEALRELTRVTEMASSDSEAFYYLGRLYFSTDKADAARAAFQTAIDKDPANAKAWNHLGQTYEALNRQSDAEQAYLRSMKVAGSKQERYEWPAFNLGVLYTNTGRARDGVVYLRQALQIKPAWSECKVKLAVALFSTGDVAAALTLMKDAVQADPENAEAHYRLATMLTKSGHPNEAKEQLVLFQKLQQLAGNKGMSSPKQPLQ